MKRLSSGLAVVITATIYFIGSLLRGVEAKNITTYSTSEVKVEKHEIKTLEIKEIAVSKKVIRQEIRQIKQKERKEIRKIFIGDSRFVGMGDSLEPSANEEYIAKVGQGYNYLSKEAYDIAKRDLDNNYRYKIVIGLGINDLGNIDKYIEFYNNININAEVYIVSVNPIAYHNVISNNSIELFNNRIKKEVLGVKYIDTYNYLMKTGYRTTDGLHYTADTYKKIKDYIDKEIA